jgi:REP element-mobilizing transposase RayT
LASRHEPRRSPPRHLGDDDDRSFFLELLAEAVDTTGAAVHAFVLMRNHYHLLLEAPSAILSGAMKGIGENYTRRFNRKYGLDGPLFRSRYRSKPINDERYLQTVVRYIHRNPPEAGFAALDYPWSSHRYYADSNAAPLWLTVGRVLQVFGSRSAYRDYVELPGNEQLTVPFREWRSDVPTGTVQAVEWALGLSPPAELDLLRAEAGVRHDLRAAMALLAMETTAHSADRLAERYGFSSGNAVRTAASRARRRFEADAEFAVMIDNARARLDQLRRAA